MTRIRPSNELFSAKAAGQGIERLDLSVCKSNQLAVRVECYAGYRGEETPRRFFFGKRRIQIRDIIDRWLAPGHRYFKVRGDDGGLYILRHDAAAGRWEMVMYQAQHDLPNADSLPEPDSLQ